LGLVAYHEWTADISDMVVAYGGLRGRTVSFWPTSELFDGGSVALSPSGNRSAITFGNQLEIWHIDPTSRAQTAENVGFQFPVYDDGKASQPAWQPTCTITSTHSNTTVSGTAGNDLICVSGSGDIVRAHGGNDVVYVTGRDDLVYGGAARDVLVVHGGGNTARGGRGMDIINLRDGAKPSVANGGLGTDVCITDPADQLTSCS
jgi:Ca2+-binding RTX toxin-like protein